MIEPERIAILSNKAARGLWGRVITEYSKNLESQHRKGFLKAQAEMRSKFFRSGEIYVQLPRNVRVQDVHVIGSFHDEDLYAKRRAIVRSNLNLQMKGDLIENNLHSLEPRMRELEKIIGAARSADADRVAVFLGYYPDGRQDKKDESRVPISAELTMSVLEAAGDGILRRFGSIDLHASQIQGMSKRPVNESTARPLFWADLKLWLYNNGLTMKDIVLVLPDASSYKRLERDIKHMGIEYGFVAKSRPEHGETDIDTFVSDADIKGRYAVSFDDMYDSGSTTIKALLLTREMGAIGARSYGTHGIFSTIVKRDERTGEVTEIIFPEDNFRAAEIHAVTTDTVERTYAYLREQSDWLTQYSAAPLIADMIYCNVSGDSHGDKLKEYWAIANGNNIGQLKAHLEQFKMPTDKSSNPKD